MSDLDLDQIKARRGRAMGAMLAVLRELPEEMQHGCVVSTRRGVKESLHTTIRLDFDALVAEVERLRTQIEAAKAHISAARAEHWFYPEYNGDPDIAWCVPCERGGATVWPCATVRALDGDS